VNQKEKTLMIGSLLESMKVLDREECKLSDVGVHLSSLTVVGNRLWSDIKRVLGMPEKEEIGVWISDYWFDIACDFIDGKCTRKAAVSRLLSWQTDFDD
jgi:hypothetical protein